MTPSVYRIPKTEDDDRSLCRACTTSPWLRDEMTRSGTVGVCAFCDEEDEPGLPLHVVASFVDKAIEDHFDQTPHSPTAFTLAILEGDGSDWDRPGDDVQDVLQDVVGVDDKVAEELREMLAEHYYDHDDAAMGTEQPFSEGSHYERKWIDRHHFHSSWKNLEDELKHARRFFSPTAHARFSFFFGDLSSHTTLEGRPLIIVAGPGQEIDHLYRGRPIRNHAELATVLTYPELELGASPPHLARANRMNPTGVPMLYGAKSVSICLSELRQPVGREVVTARFDIIRPLRLLDVDALALIRTTKEWLDPSHLEECQRVEFFKSLSRRITRPVMPDDEHLEYLITQVIAEYLAVHHQLDGMLYNSVQASEARANIVLFPHAISVEPIAWPSNMKVELQSPPTGDDDEYIMVFREPGEEPADATPSVPPPANPALRLVQNSIQVHRIQAVTCTYTQTRVESWLPTPGKENHFTQF